MIVSKKDFFRFIILTYVITFSIQGVTIFANQNGKLLMNSPLGMLFYVMSTLIPTFVAATILIRGKYLLGIKQLLQRMFHIKASWKHYCLAVLFVFLQYILLMVFTPVREDGNMLVVVAMVIPCIFDGGLEELGWRYLLGPNLEQKMNYFAATFCTGIIWYCWHLLHFLMNGTGQYHISLLIYFVFVIGATFMLSALYRITQNLWVCTICHAIINALSFRYSVATYFGITLATSVILVIVSLLLVTYLERKEKN